jgi:hypothetical protein
MSKAAETAAARMCMALKRDQFNTNPLVNKPQLGPEAKECLAEGNWEGVAVAYLADMVAGRRVTMGKEALRYFREWIRCDDVIRPRYMQELIREFNAVADKLVLQILAEDRPLNRAERRASKKRRAG